ncbi:WD40 repeat domain-containing protein [Streptomyces sp. NPDC015171]|uniref:WD40 repeat domain-containing protein n=1 Tax=Streptomyces sp. NPDC015171 TaxID=3364945 RepID=UPI0037016C1E
MNVEELVREALREEADGQPPAPAGFADRVLGVRRRRRTRRFVSVAAATAAVVAVAVGVPLLDSGRGRDVRPSQVVDSPGIQAHPDQSPPRERIGAGDAALAAYYTAEIRPRTATRGVAERTYRLLDPGTGRYEKDARWSFVAVAPGLKTAAVLERDLPARRIGLLDLATGEVERWIPVRHGVGGLAFSYDGTRLVATTYGENPDLRTREKLFDSHGRDRWTWTAGFGASSRSGFYDLDVASGAGSWSPVASGRDIGSRMDFAYSRSGRLVYGRYLGGRDGLQQFYDLNGRKTAAPANERYLRSDVPARLSPSGGLAALGLAKEAGGSPGRSWSSVRDPRTGKEITKVRGGHLLAWADEKHLIAWERVTSLEEEYRPRLVLVTIGSDKVVPLSGVQEPWKPTDVREPWEPVFARR